MSEKTKLSVLISQATLTMVDELKSDTDAASRSEVLRNCIRLAFAVLSAQNSGAKIWIENQEGKVTSLVFRPMFPVEPEAKEKE